MKALKDASVRLVLADPPYGIGVQGVKWDGADGYMGFAKAWLAEATRILQPGGTLLYFSSPCTIWSSRINVLLQDTFQMNHQQTLTWVYGQGGDARLESMRAYAVRSEIIEWWTKPPGMHTFNPALAAERYSEDEKRVALAKGVGRVSEASLNKGRPPRTWADVPRENSRSKERQYSDVKHPSMKPLMLCERLIAVHSNSADRVIVPFAGSGSEVLTAAKLGREVVGFETESDYIELMRARFQGHGINVEMK
jgi:DNA modification methylase